MNNKSLTLRFNLTLSLIGVCSVFLLASLLISCKEDTEPTPAPAPTITSFTPAHGVAGSTVTITGTNFSLTTTENSVKINDVEATVSSTTATEVVVIVPETTTGKISITRNAKIATSTTDFEVIKDFPRNGLFGFWPFTGDGKEKGMNNTLFEFGVGSGWPTLTADRFGTTGQAINFDGTQYTNIGDLAGVVKSFPSTPWTVSFWIDPGVNSNPFVGLVTNTNTNNEYLDVRLSNNGETSDYYLYVFGNINTFFHLGVPTNRFIPNLADNLWINLTITYDGTVFKIFKDNVEVYTNAVSESRDGQRNLRLGGGYSSSFYIGKMDDLIIYDRVLTTTERTQVYEQTVSKYQ